MNISMTNKELSKLNIEYILSTVDLNENQTKYDPLTKEQFNQLIGSNKTECKVSFKEYNIQVKASGGIKTYADAINLINAGATRLGTSSGVDIILEEGNKND